MKWKTKDGKRIEVSKMDDEHLVNTIRMLYRGGRRIRSGMDNALCHAECALRGEMALQSVEDESNRISRMSDDELVEEQHPIVLEMIIEAEKRSLKWA